MLTRKHLFGALSLACGLFALIDSASAEVFLLRSGGRVEGQWLNPQRAVTDNYLLRNLAGVQISLAGPQVQRVLATSDVQKQYEDLLHKMPQTVTGHWQLAQWCRDAGLTQQRKFHLEEILKLDTNHEEARLALGYGKFATGGWMTPDEFMLRQGYVKYHGAWKLPQEIELAAREREFELADKQWRKQLKIWIGNLDSEKRGADAAQSIQGIRDPAAANALADILADEKNPIDVRQMCLDVIGKLPPGMATSQLIQLALHDSNENLRERCLAELRRQGGHLAIPVFVKALTNKDNKVVRRAAVGLQVLGATSATKPLIDALVTTHKTVKQGNPGQMGASFGGGGDNGGLGGLSMGSKTQVIIDHQKNDEVLSALLSLHPGVNHSYDKEKWRQWLMSQKGSAVLDFRRVE
ncbi:HEAT repeat domain-containing protein [Anatilimnocola floriformis]|uniref:HEAT repeat domain-containing protein n=1 Tax=Anatilimnocola floriformis TaxID=2948575 RepID=UPI0020C4D6E7|nr:HEAT repeat domain-containing protein [Anatilimnocola floriformis]